MSAAKVSARWLVKPGAKVDLAKIHPGSTAGAPGDKEATVATFKSFDHKLAELQERVYAEDKRGLLIVLQAIDAGGKDGTIKHVFGAFNAVGTRVASFKVPSEEERKHDFLWRVHKQVPAHGEVVIFNRSHYEQVLVVRVKGLEPENLWRAHYDHIVEFEKNLVAAGTTIVKLFLHISKDEQAERFRDRITDPTKVWKFRAGDLEDRALWDDYQAAFEEAIERTSTKDAPWYVVPADKKWYRNWAVSNILVDTLEAMDPQYPPPEDDLSKIVIE